MNELKRGVAWELLNAIGQLVVASILWVFCCLPIITIGAASTALYYSVTKVIRRDRDTVVKSFFYCFKLNFRQSIFINLMFLAYGAIIVFIALPHIRTWMESGQVDATLYICGGLALLSAWMLPYVYPVLSRFYFSTLQIMKFVLLICVRYFYISILLFILLIVAAVFSAYYPTFLMIIPALFAYISSFLLEPVFKKYSTPDDTGNFDTWYADSSTEVSE